MSMILEALSRAEKERQADEGTQLDTSRYVTSSTIKEDRFKKWVLIVLVANFVVIILFGAIYFWNNNINNTHRTQNESELHVEKSRQIQNTAPTINDDSNQLLLEQTADQGKPLNNTQQVEADKQITSIAITSSPENSLSLESEAQVNSSKPVPKAKKVIAKSVAKKVPPIQYSSQPLSQTPSSVKPNTATIEKAVAREMQMNAPTVYTRLLDMPVAQRSQLNKYEVNVHVYDDNPQSRFVLINMVKYKEGDQISGVNASIISIVPEGVVLNYANQQVLIERNK